MPLQSGTKLAQYEILDPIGAGGMGEVYRARDTKLGREVAIKVLPEAFSQDEARLARFEREARLLASLNHPNIATLHGLEQSANTHFLVMELVPGETLAEQVQRGPTPVGETLPLFQQIAEGLEAAHEKGVIHRDLKPANIKVTPEGKVKLLDFGLAKAFAEEGGASDLSQSPTMTREATQAGVIMGTAAYMSPEQARGKTVDKRTDIWAFGCCLYEVLTGRKAFEGETVTDIFAAIVRGEPRWDALPPLTPYSIRRLLPRCVEKDPNRRLHDIADARLELEASLTEPSPQVDAGAPIPKRRLISWSLAGLVAGTIIASLVVWNLKASRPGPIGRLALTVPASQRLSSLVISPGGTHVAYIARKDDKEQLYLRPIDRLEAEPIADTEGAFRPFFSPDGLWLGFFADGKLKKVSIRGGAPQILCEVAVSDTSVASWTPDGLIFMGADLRILQVSSNGGTPEAVTAADSEKGEVALILSHVLPDGKAILFSVWIGGRAWDELPIVVYSLETGERRVLIEGGTNARYVPTGHLVYVRSGTLMAVPFDLARLEVTGAAVPVIEDILQSPGSSVAEFSFSNEGWLVYLPGGVHLEKRTLVWVDREGRTEPLPAPGRPYLDPRISPDGRRLAITIEGPLYDAWVYELDRDTLTRLTFEGDSNAFVWTPDGNQVTFASTRAGPYNLFWMPADGSGGPERLHVSENPQFPTSWSSDGRLLAFTEFHPDTAGDIWVLSMDGERTPHPFLVTPFNEGNAEFSPDDGWLAYESDESGQFEVYVRRYPGPGGKRQISGGGGSDPLWAPDGRALLYRAEDKMMAVPVGLTTELTVGKARLLFEGRYTSETSEPGRDYDVSPDGQRFLMIRNEEESGPKHINVVVNWFEELKRLVPTN